MKCFLPSFLFGLVVGALLMVWLPRHRSAGAPEAAEGKHEDEPARDALHPSEPAKALAGLEVQAITWTNAPVETRAAGRVLDVAPLIQAWQELTVARVTADASQKELVRLQALFAQDRNASARALEAGQANSQRDALQARAAEARLATTWGPALADRPDLADIVQRLSSAKAALVRLEVPANDSVADEPRSVWVEVAEGTASRKAADWFVPAPTRDPLTQGRAFLALLSADGLVPGMAMEAGLVSGTTQRTGARVPDSAVVRKDGESFVYSARSDGGFTRIPVVLDQPLDHGWLVSTGLPAGLKIVVTGAQILLSNEVMPSMGEAE